jgi:protein-S-isoprenylcysteine O-methyltransferase Ste14
MGTKIGLTAPKLGIVAKKLTSWSTNFSISSDFHAKSASATTALRLGKGLEKPVGHNPGKFIQQAAKQMSLFQEYRRQLGGSLLVLLQFGLLLWLAVMAAPQFLQGRVAITCWLLALLSGALAGWTLLHNRLGNFNIHPAPKSGGVLVTSGPYRWLRHPMYGAVLLAAAALALLSGSLSAWLAWGALALVLWVKAHLEEHWLREHHPAYADYCKKSKRFLPWLL